MADELTLAQREALQAPVRGMEYVIEAAAGLVIESDDDLQIAAELLAQIALAMKAIEEQRQALTRPLNQVLRTINEAAKQTLGNLPDASAGLRTAISAYHARVDAERAQAKAAEQERTGDRVVDPGSLPAETRRQIATSGSAKVSTRKRWTFEVVDEHALAKAVSKTKAAWEANGAMMMAAASEINDRVKNHGLREFPGLRIYEKSDAVVSS